MHGVDAQITLAQHQKTFTSLQALCFEPCMLTRADEDDRRALIRAWNNTVAQATAQVNAGTYDAAQATTNHLTTFIMAMQQAYLKAHLVLQDATTTRYAPLTNTLGKDTAEHQIAFQSILLEVLTPLAGTILRDKTQDPAQLNTPIAELIFNAIVKRIKCSWSKPHWYSISSEPATWHNEQDQLEQLLLVDLTNEAHDFITAFINCMELKHQLDQPATSTEKQIPYAQRLNALVDALDGALTASDHGLAQTNDPAQERMINYLTTFLINEREVTSTLANLADQALRTLYTNHVKITHSHSFKTLAATAPGMTSSYLALTQQFFSMQPTGERFKIDLLDVASKIAELIHEHSQTNLLTIAVNARDLAAEALGKRFPTNPESPICQELAHMLYIVNTCIHFGDAPSEVPKNPIEQLLPKNIQNNEWVKKAAQLAALLGAAASVPLAVKAKDAIVKLFGTAQPVPTPEAAAVPPQPGTETIKPAQPPTPEQAQPVPG